MKIIKIPVFDRNLYCYSGKEEWTAFNKKIVELGADKTRLEESPPGNGAGRCFGGALWVSNLKDVGLLVHETSHFIDNLIEFLGLEGTESRAYVTEWYMVRVLKWAKVIK